jgi:hypothetical protein
MNFVASPASPGPEFEQAGFRRDASHLGERKREIAAEDMEIIVRQQKQVSGLHLDHLASTGETRQARSANERRQRGQSRGVSAPPSGGRIAWRRTRAR